MTSGAPILQYPVRSWLSSTCHVPRVLCHVWCVTERWCGDVTWGHKVVQQLAATLISTDNWEYEMLGDCGRWDTETVRLGRAEMRREILYLGAGVRGSVASVWRLLSVTWWRDVTPTWRFNDSLQRNLSHPKVWTSILFLFSATGQVQRVIVLKPIKLDYRSAAAQLGGGWSSPIVTSTYSTALSHHPSRPFWTSIPI